MTTRASTFLFLGVAFLAALFALPSFAQGPLGAGTRHIVVVVEGLRNSRGSVVGALYTSASRWLREGESAADCHARIRAGVARCVFTVPTGGPVAFAGLHDEDDDGVFDRDLFGLPQEGYAFSNDVRESFGPPSFTAASFVPPAVGALVVQARYGI